METKQWWKSKTIWSAVLAVLITAYNAVAPGQHWPAIPEQVYVLLTAFGLYGLRTANTTISSAPVPPKAPDNVVPAQKDGIGGIQ